MRRSRLFIALAVPCVLLAACLSRPRLNSSCRYVGDSAAALHLERAADREHLAQDAQIAEELAMRYGDVGRPAVTMDSSLRLRAACFSRLVTTISERHAVSPDEVQAAALRRGAAFDVTVVWIPVAIVLIILSDRVTARVARGMSMEDRAPRLVGLALLAPAVAVIVLISAQLWSVWAEMIRLGDGHISYRASRLPVAQHGWLVFSCSMAIYACVCATRYFRARREQQLSAFAGQIGRSGLPIRRS